MSLSLSQRSPIPKSASISLCIAAFDAPPTAPPSASILSSISTQTPATEEKLAEIGYAQEADVDRAVRAARRGYEKIPLKRYNYGLRICPEPVHWGGLSGSTYTEAVSWGKFVPPEEGGRFAEVFDDATVALPLVVGAVLDRLGYFDRKPTKK